MMAAHLHCQKGACCGGVVGEVTPVYKLKQGVHRLLAQQLCAVFVYAYAQQIDIRTCVHEQPPTDTHNPQQHLVLCMCKDHCAPRMELYKCLHILVPALQCCGVTDGALGSMLQGLGIAGDCI